MIWSALTDKSSLVFTMVDGLINVCSCFFQMDKEMKNSDMSPRPAQKFLPDIEKEQGIELLRENVCQLDLVLVCDQLINT